VQTQPFCILSLDGGGSMGSFAASVLATFEHETGWRIIEHFDLLTGTSTGGSSPLPWRWGRRRKKSPGSTRRED
jgi:patatin-like phospholipase/acyl hydrolase